MSRVLDYLIVDDDHSQFRLVQALFKDLHMSHRCHHASSGKAALDFLHQRFPYEKALRPDLILLDLNMPGMTGCEVLHSLKKDPLTRAIPTIILSSSIAESDVNACYGEHANAYIQKPVDLDATIKVFKEIDRFWSHVEFSKTTRTDL